MDYIVQVQARFILSCVNYGFWSLISRVGLEDSPIPSSHHDASNPRPILGQSPRESHRPNSGPNAETNVQAMGQLAIYLDYKFGSPGVAHYSDPSSFVESIKLLLPPPQGSRGGGTPGPLWLPPKADNFKKMRLFPPFVTPVFESLSLKNMLTPHFLPPVAILLCPGAVAASPVRIVTASRVLSEALADGYAQGPRVLHKFPNPKESLHNERWLQWLPGSNSPGGLVFSVCRICRAAPYFSPNISLFKGVRALNSGFSLVLFMFDPAQKTSTLFD